MTAIQTRPSELAVPVGALRAMREALAAEVGDDGAARALRVAGSAAGTAMFRAFLAGAGIPGDDDAAARERLAEMPDEQFWAMLSTFFGSRGWGRLRFAAVHEGVGALDAADWVEANADAGVGRPSCFFTTGMIAGLLGRITGDEVAVLEVACRSHGAGGCRFLFGSADALGALYSGIAAGHDVDASLAALA